MNSQTGHESVEIVAGYLPGLVGKVAELHGRYYAEVWKCGAPFEILIAREFSEFLEHYDPDRDLVLSARTEGRLIGSITLIGRQNSPDGVQLRFFIVDPAFHGLGVGKDLLLAALDWCRARNYRRVFLWTVDNLPRSRRLYEKNGFRVVENVPDDRYTVMHHNLKMVLDLDQDH